MACEMPAYTVRFEDGITEELLLTPLGFGRYRVEQSSLVEDHVNLGDVIAAETANDGTIRFLHVLLKSPYVTLRWAISERNAESHGLTTFLDQVIQLGGLWERPMGCILILHLSHTFHFDAEREFKRHTEQRNV
jgi:hypothetical protein